MSRELPELEDLEVIFKLLGKKNRARCEATLERFDVLGELQ